MNYPVHTIPLDQWKTLTPKKEPTMNLSTAVFLLPDSTARAIMVTYESHETAPRTMFKTFDKSIKIDDFVIVPTDTRHKLTVCKVVAIDVDVNFDCSTHVDWIVGTVDMANINDIKRQEDNIINAIKAAEKLKKKNELAASMNALLASNGQDIKLLSIGGGATPAVTEETKVA